LSDSTSIGSVSLLMLVRYTSCRHFLLVELYFVSLGQASHFLVSKLNKGFGYSQAKQKVLSDVYGVAS